jgi:hypothetical protein
VTRPVPELAAAAQEVLTVLDRAGLRACLIGGLAVPRWGEPRATSDVDVSVLAPYGEEGAALDTLLGHFAPRGPDARGFALAHRVLLLRAANGVGLDIALAAFPFEVEALDAASTWELTQGVSVRTCSAEHLIVYKLVAARTRDLTDVEGIVRRQAGSLDVGVIRRWGTVFAELKEDPDILRPFEAALKKAGITG